MCVIQLQAQLIVLPSPCAQAHEDRMSCPFRNVTITCNSRPMPALRAGTDAGWK
jgi:hypothetical protein